MYNCNCNRSGEAPQAPTEVVMTVVELYHLATPLVGLFLMIVGFTNLNSLISIAIFAASTWIFLGMMAK